MGAGYNPNGITDEEFAAFCDLQSEEGAIPAGRIEYVTGKVMYRSGNGSLLSGPDYIKKYGFDPEPVWARIKAHQKKVGTFHDPVEIAYIKPIKMTPRKLGMISRQ
jgi:hypothetical protein